ncbi:MAG TPA: deoxynucleoside kinase, partial [Candidatus Acidoferrum sp.]|nr:deoxynucleoside kinase [Candidatus Acidoferrum sp.]
MVKTVAASPRYIVVEGPIGVGKTSLVDLLSERLGARKLLEVADDNPFMPNFYREPKRFAFQTQL